MTERYSIDLSAVSLFHTVAAVGSLSKAAEVVGLSQPSVSTKLQKLERQLGIRLLDRSPTGSKISSTGRALLRSSQELLDAADRVRVSAEALRHARDSNLRLIASYSIAEYLLPSWLATFGRDHPGLHPEIDVTNSHRVIPKVLSGEVHLGFIEGPDLPRGLSSRTIARDELVLVAGSENPLEGPISTKQLVQLRLIARESGSGTRAALEQALLRAGSPPTLSPALEASSSSAVKAAVIESRGLAVLSRLTVALEIKAGLLREIPIDGLDLTRDLKVCWEPTQLRSLVAKEFLSFLKKLPY